MSLLRLQVSTAEGHYDPSRRLLLYYDYYFYYYYYYYYGHIINCYYCYYYYYYYGYSINCYYCYLQATTTTLLTNTNAPFVTGHHAWTGRWRRTCCGFTVGGRLTDWLWQTGCDWLTGRLTIEVLADCLCTTCDCLIRTDFLTGLPIDKPLNCYWLF